MHFYPNIFDILDHEDETENDMDQTQIYKRIKEEFNLDYQFDNTQQNIQREEEELLEDGNDEKEEDNEDEVKR